ncbi:MAG TPA: epoxyqueuosine reductase QueH, partial [Desulfomonilia bacterium]|nr:epoxyqueuosine reductase QueH [Desulfomonilia bacterium]
MSRILLHVCCAPCSTAVVERLQEQGYAIKLFF